MQKPKIFFYIHSLSIGGGAENICVRVAEATAQAGFEVVICAMTDEYPSFEDRLAKNTIRVIRLQGQTKSMLQIISELTILLKQEQPAILSCWLYPCIVSGQIAGRLAHVPEIITNLRGPDLKKNKVKVFVDSLLHRFSTGVIAVSPSVADVFMYREKYSPEKITVITNGQAYPALPQISKVAARQVLELPAQAFLIGCIGRLYTEKNQRHVVEALPIIVAACPQVQLVLVGDGPERERLGVRVAELGLTQHVIFAGWQKDVYSYLQALDLCILPSKYEGHPGTVLQAWYAQVPVLAAKVTGIKDLVVDGKNGLLFSLNNTAELSNLVINIVREPSIMQAMVADGYTQATTVYTLDAMNKQHIAYLRARSLTYEIINTWAALESLAQEWQKLNTQFGFQSLGNLKYWHEHFAADKQLCVVIVRSQGAVVGIAPLYRQGTVVSWLGEGRMNYLSLLGTTNWSGLEAFLKKQGVRGFILTNVRGDSYLAQQLSGFAVLKIRPCPYVAIDTQLSWDKYLASVLKNKRRYEIRTGEEALRAKGSVSLVTRRGGEVTATEFMAIQTLYMKRWSGSYRARYLQKEQKYFDYQKFLMQSPEAYVSLLFAGETLVSFMFGFIKNNIFVDYWVAHDSAYADCSVGNVHVGMVVHDMHAQGVTLFDFSIGEEVYKRKWAKEDVLVKDYYRGSGLAFWKRYLVQILKEKLRSLIKK